MAVELLGGAEKIRRPIVIQCHTPAPGGRQNRAFLRLFSMIWPVPTKTKVRFPSPAPTVSPAFSQFSRSLSYECHTKPPGSALFSEAFTAGIETVVQGQVTIPAGDVTFPWPMNVGESP